MPIGFEIHPAPPRPSASLLEQFRTIVTPHLSDNMSRMFGTVGLKRYNPRGKLVGIALTVKTRPGDNLMIHKALNLAQPGDVLVVDGGGDVSQALVGELMKLYAESQGVVGFVIEAPSATSPPSRPRTSRATRGARPIRGPTRTAPARSTCR